VIIGNTEITREDMPSYVSPSKQPFHRYQSMQDTLNNALGNVNFGNMQPTQKINSTMEAQSNQWSNNK